MTALERWSLWWCWPFYCTDSSECDCVQHQADDDEALSLLRWDGGRSR